jgi:hypothetical protein
MIEILSKPYPNEFDRAVDISKLLAETDECEWPMMVWAVETTPRPIAERQTPAALHGKQQDEFELHVDRMLAEVAGSIVHAEAVPEGNCTFAGFLERRLHGLSPMERTVMLYAWMGTSPLPLSSLTLRSRTPGAAGETRSWSVGGWGSALRDHLKGK